MLGKILILAAVLFLVIYGHRWIKRFLKRDEQKIDAFEKCPKCGTYFAKGTPHACD